MNKPKTIGIDCRMWNETGVGRYQKNIVENIAKIDTNNNYILFTLDGQNPLGDEYQNFKSVKANVYWHSFAEQIILPIIYYKNKLDILFVPHFNVPILYFGKTYATVHDLTILKYSTGRATKLPYIFYKIKRQAFKLNLFFTLLKSKKIFVVSDFVKQDILQTFSWVKLDENKFVKTSNAAQENFKRNISTQILQKYNISQPYVFYVGNAHPHKNLERLVLAFEEIYKKDEKLKLVLGGKKEFFLERIQNENINKSFIQNIIFPGFIDDVDLPSIYSMSEAFINPSLYEGFGIQILEAFCCETKVICSNTSSLPEVSGGFAYYFNPTDTHDITNVILNSISDNSWEEKKLLALKWAKSFLWEDSARKVLNTIYENGHS